MEDWVWIGFDRLVVWRVRHEAVELWIRFERGRCWAEGFVKPVDGTVVGGDIVLVVRRGRIAQCQLRIDGASSVRLETRVEFFDRAQSAALAIGIEIPVIVERRAREGRRVGDVDVHHGDAE